MPAQKTPRRISPLYARHLNPGEKKALRAFPAGDVSSEINLLRVLHASLLAPQSSVPVDLKSGQQTLQTSLILGEALARLIRVHSVDHDPLAELRDEIEQAVEELRNELEIG